MKLNERQIALRACFRETIVDFWNCPDNKYKMFNVLIVCQEKLGGTQYDIFGELLEIPSIGWLSSEISMQVWTARYHKTISDALWDGKSKEYVMRLWKTSKRAKSAPPRKNAEEKKEYAKINKNIKKIKAIGELKGNMPDRWQRTAWNVCK